MKLNQREQQVLKAMQDGKNGTCMPYSGQFNPNAYYTIDKIGKCTREMTKLIKLGLVINEQTGYNNHNIYLTEEGKNFKCELDEPYDVWVVSSDWNLTLNKYSGFLDGSTIRRATGETARESDKRKFFTDREEAFKYLFKLQHAKITHAKRIVLSEDYNLTVFEDHYKNPDMDKEGYL